MDEYFYPFRCQCHAKVQELHICIDKSETRTGSNDSQFTVFLLSIKSCCTSWVIYKRFSEFAELHKDLASKFNSTKLPKLPPKKLIGALDMEFIRQRRQDLEKYLSGLTRDPDIVRSKMVGVFLQAKKADVLGIMCTQYFELKEGLAMTEKKLTGMEERVKAMEETKTRKIDSSSVPSSSILASSSSLLSSRPLRTAPQDIRDLKHTSSSKDLSQDVSNVNSPSLHAKVLDRTISDFDARHPARALNVLSLLQNEEHTTDDTFYPDGNLKSPNFHDRTISGFDARHPIRDTSMYSLLLASRKMERMEEQLAQHYYQRFVESKHNRAPQPTSSDPSITSPQPERAQSTPSSPRVTDLQASNAYQGLLDLQRVFRPPEEEMGNLSLGVDGAQEDWPSPPSPSSASSASFASSHFLNSSLYASTSVGGSMVSSGSTNSLGSAALNSAVAASASAAAIGPRISPVTKPPAGSPTAAVTTASIIAAAKENAALAAAAAAASTSSSSSLASTTGTDAAPPASAPVPVPKSSSFFSSSYSPRSSAPFRSNIHNSPPFNLSLNFPFLNSTPISSPKGSLAPNLLTEGSSSLIVSSEHTEVDTADQSIRIRCDMHASDSILAEHVEDFISYIQPTEYSEAQYEEVLQFVEQMVNQALASECHAHGSFALKTYLPDSDLDVSAFFSTGQEAFWGQRLVSRMCELAAVNANPKLAIRSVTFVNAECKLVKAQVGSFSVDISANQSNAMISLALCEHVDRLVGKNHLFKRTVLLATSWALNDAHILGSSKGLMSTYCLRSVVLYIFNAYHEEISTPLEGLWRVISYLDDFNWDEHGLGVFGPVWLHALPMLSPVSGVPCSWPGSKALLTKKLMEEMQCSRHNQPPLTRRFINVIDPAQPANNLGRSIELNGALQIRQALKTAAARFRTALMEWDRIRGTQEVDEVRLKDMRQTQALEFVGTMFGDSIKKYKGRVHPAFRAKYGYQGESCPSSPQIGSMSMHMPLSPARRDLLSNDISEIERRVAYARQFDEPQLNEQHLIELVVQLLSQHGIVPVGKLGSLLHQATSNHSLPATLKERFGGLKKLLMGYDDIFLIGDDHPFNPSVSLRNPDPLVKSRNTPNPPINRHSQGGSLGSSRSSNDSLRGSNDSTRPKRRRNIPGRMQDDLRSFPEHTGSAAPLPTNGARGPSFVFRMDPERHKFVPRDQQD